MAFLVLRNIPIVGRQKAGQTGTLIDAEKSANKIKLSGGGQPCRFEPIWPGYRLPARVRAR
jgi:hypothetical protein